MFDNIGRKIKSLVKTVFAVEVILSLLVVIALSFNPIGIIISLGVIFLAWISSFTMYGFGELIDNSQKQFIQNEKIINLLSQCLNDNVVLKSGTNKDNTIRKTGNNTGFNIMSVSDTTDQPKE